MELVEVDILKEMVMHMSFTKVHSIKYKYTIECDKHIMNGRVFYSETHTDKINDFEYGKSESFYYWTNKSKPYNNIIDFLKNSGIKLNLNK